MDRFQRAGKAESQERINDSDSSSGDLQLPIEIQRDVTFTVQSESIDGHHAVASGAPRSERWETNNVTTVVSGVR